MDTKPHTATDRTPTDECRLGPPPNHPPAKPVVRPALLDDAPPGADQRANPGLFRRGAAAGSRRVLGRLLEHLDHGRLRIIEEEQITEFGQPSAHPITVTVHHRDAWWAVAAEGSIGLGRGYIEGWWTTDDPVGLLRLVAQNMPALHRWQHLKSRFWRFAPDRLVQRRSSDKDREDIAAHYDIGTDFFAHFLDETLTYSSAVFISPSDSLDAASKNKYDRLLDKLDVRPTDRVLEIGTGWGGFAQHAVSTRGCSVTTTTISADQYRHAQRRITEAGLQHRVTVLNDDWRHLTGCYDKVVSIEMIEAVDWRDYQRFFAKIGQLLAPGGAAALQMICVPGQRFESAKHTEDFIKRFVFPGGGLPSIGAVTSAIDRATDMHVLDLEDFSAHYAETLRRWRERFDHHEQSVAELGYDQRFRKLWRFYLAYCEAAFAERFCTANQIVMVRPQWRPPGLALRPH